MNEALPYVEATHHMYGGKWGQGPGPGENLPSWMILGQQWRDPCLFAGLQGGQRFPRKWVEAGVVVANTVAELAAKIGVDAGGYGAPSNSSMGSRGPGGRRLPPRRKRL